MGNEKIKLVGIIILLGIIFSFVGVAFIVITTNSADDINRNNINITVQKNKQAEVFAFMDEWWENLNQENQYLFYFYTLNFGDKEAKNIRVKCELTVGDELLKSKETRIGNIASHSYNYEEIRMNYYAYLGNETMGNCYITNCSDCRLMRQDLKMWEKN